MLDSITKTFGENVRKERLKKGLSQEDFAEVSGFHRTYIGMLERAERNITLSNLEKIAKASVNVNWIGLPTFRKVGINSEVLKKYKDLILQVRRYAFDIKVKITSFDGQVYLTFDTLDANVKTISKTLKSINNILDRYKIHEPYIEFEDTYIKIELK